MSALATSAAVATAAQHAPRTNLPRLVANVVAGQIANPIIRNPYRIGRDGILRIAPGTGGIVLNHRTGDRALGIVGDHVEPGVSLHNNDREVVGGRDAPNRGLLFYSCIGNPVRVTTGPAAGARGVVVGKHGGINHVIVDFPPAVLRRLRIGDRMQIDALGQGLALPEYPSVRTLNLSPRLLSRWGIRRHGAHLHVPVTHLVPGTLMGSGLGRSEGVLGDTDIQLSDPAIRRRFRLGALRMGDLVAIVGLDARHGASLRSGILTFGVVVHSDSNVAGHGPGVTPLLIGSARVLRPMWAPDANIASLLGLRARIAPSSTPTAGERRTLWRLAAGGQPLLIPAVSAALAPRPLSRTEPARELR